MYNNKLFIIAFIGIIRLSGSSSKRLSSGSCTTGWNFSTIYFCFFTLNSTCSFICGFRINMFRFRASIRFVQFIRCLIC
ncbi:hypothetical protein C1645_773716 [Glomus cerebriforme]|uniref:Uncharacterized protein n=1 Tax=Glomus cerebriforme TaxID=658196 RepID=A0A397SS46_9GLOM|nr:hypothetical protein C1645_773716 [Glomus cerebriforme]